MESDRNISINITCEEQQVDRVEIQRVIMDTLKNIASSFHGASIGDYNIEMSGPIGDKEIDRDAIEQQIKEAIAHLTTENTIRVTTSSHT